MLTAIYGGRGNGKTYQLVQWYKEDPEGRRILVSDSRMREALVQEYDIPRKHIHLMNDELRASTAGLKPEIKFGVDNIEFLLQRLLGYRVERITFNGDAKLPYD